MNEARDAMERLLAPAQPVLEATDATLATQLDVDALAKTIGVAKTIAGAASLFTKSCEGGDSYENNCAHYLSDAFLRAGFDDLKAPAACINTRCATNSKRPVRARDMWCWFQEKQTESRDKIPSKEGFWAVFQLNEAEYWGGHVIIIDTDKNIVYGTAHYPKWTQHCYRW